MTSSNYYEALALFPEHQQSIFIPQVEQLNMELVPMGFGVLGKTNIPQVTGWCWAGSIDDDCLITIVSIVPLEDFPFFEHPKTEYANIALLSRSSAQMVNAIWKHDKHAPNNQDIYLRPTSFPSLEAESEHVAIFTMVPRLYESVLTAGTAYFGVCIHLLSRYFKKLDRLYSGELNWLKEAFDNHEDVAESLELRSILRSITPRQANMPAAHLHYEGKALEAISALARCLSNSNESDKRTSISIADNVKELLANSLDKPPTLDELASACYTSRTSLCREFKQSCGTSIGNYLADLRIERAKALLESTEEPIADIARKVGYRHASTFATMFKRACKTSPQAWRSTHR